MFSSATDHPDFVISHSIKSIQEEPLTHCNNIIGTW